MVTSGALSLQDALLLVTRRAQLMASMCKIGETSMLACNTSALSASQLITETGLSRLTVACDNSVTDSVVAGPVDQLDQLAQHAKERGIRCKRLDVPLGFHSTALDPIMPEFEAECKALTFFNPKIALGSCLHGRLVEEGDLGSSYPLRQTRGTVRFTELVSSLFNREGFQNATFIEIGPNPITLPMVRTKFSGQDSIFLPSMAKGQDSWVTISRSLQQLSLRYDSIQWRAVFDGTKARVVDLPEYPFQMHSLYVPFKEASLDASASVKTGQGAKPSMFHLLEDVVTQDARKGLSTFRCSLDALSVYIEGHSVHGFPLCPASVYHGMVLEAMHYQATPDQDQVAVVTDINFGHPLVYSQERAASTVLLTTEKTSKGISESNEGRFTVTSADTSLCSGQIAWKPASDVQAYLARRGAYAKRQMKLLHRHQSQRNLLHRNVIYNIIFPRVVAYSEMYQAIKELNVSETDLDGYGTFEVPESTFTGRTGSPVFMDTLLHAAGFVANSQAKLTDAFICSKVESTVVLDTAINPKDTFLIYCSLLECGDGERIGEAFAMTLDGTAVASIEGMHFKRLNLRSFASHLSRQTGQKSTSGAPQPVAPRLQAQMKDTNPPVSSVSDPMDTVASVIAELCEQPRAAVTPGKRLADLGIDSLMQIELSQSLKRQFPYLNTNGLLESDTVRDIQNYVMSVRGDMSGPLSSKSNSDSVDDGSTGSGKLTPYTEVTPTPHEVTGLLLQLVAKTCGFQPSEVHQDMALGSLGMDSLMTIEFQEGMQSEFGYTLASDVLSPALTIRELARKLTEDNNSSSDQGLVSVIERATSETLVRGSTEEQFIVQLQRGQDHTPPLILFHDGSGLIKQYEGLADIGCNVFGIRNPDLTVGPHWARDLDDMARRYAASIPAVVKARQVVLGGKFHC